MNPSSRPVSRRAFGTVAPFALAAGLLIGHVVEAMGRTTDGNPATMVAAFLFVGGAMAGTVCGLAGLVGQDKAGSRALMPGLIVATGFALVVAALPGLL